MRYEDQEISFTKPKAEVEDCTIYFPMKGLVSRADRRTTRKPKFIIVPKDEYVKSHPEFKNSRKGSLQNNRNYREIHKATIPEYREDSLSQADRSSPSSLPKKTLFEKRQHRMIPKFVSNNRAIECKSKQRKSNRKCRKSLENRYKDKKGHIFDPLIRRKARHLKNFQKKHSMKMELPETHHTIASTHAGTSKNRDNVIRSKLDMTKNYTSGYSQLKKLLQK